jgi:NAD(P)-dependent dehydrogenase (short-subunit alcohol dehydrogenase family)
MKDKLSGKLALVTGAGSGIGRATARALAAAGARLAVVDVDGDRVAAMERELGAQCVFAKRVDVSKKDEMRALAADVHGKVGVLDVLVNNAGVGHSGGILDSSLEDWEWVIGINLWGVIYGCHFFVPKMVERGAGGHVVNVASGFGLVAGPSVAPYCTTKFAVVGLSESLRGELAPHGIGVTAVCPGVIATDIINRGRFADESQRTTTQALFTKRGHKPEEVARAALKAIANDVAVMPVGAEVWATWLGKRVSPGLTMRLSREVEKRVKNARA